MFLSRHVWIATTSSFFVCSALFSAGTSSSDQGSSTPTSAKPFHLPTHGKEEKLPPVILHPKKLLPLMAKPFGMPGVVGFVNNKWEGNDYLGYLTSHIGISIEIVKGENVPNIDQTKLEASANEIFTKGDLTPQADVPEGPPLPFLHVLIFIYPIEKDRYVIFANGRLFEQIQVMRKNFSPAGYWQGITWENQDIVTATDKELETQLKSTIDKLVKAFADRYRQFNPTNPDSKEGEASDNK